MKRKSLKTKHSEITIKYEIFIAQKQRILFDEHNKKQLTLFYNILIKPIHHVFSLTDGAVMKNANGWLK